MSRISSSLKLTSCTVALDNDDTLETITCQLQRSSPVILCVVNGRHVRRFESSDVLPTPLRFEYKRSKPYGEIYCFRHIETNETYAVFKREYAKLFYPNLDKVDRYTHSRVSGHNSILEVVAERPRKQIVIVDNGQRYVFDCHDRPVEVSSQSLT